MGVYGLMCVLQEDVGEKVGIAFSLIKKIRR